MSKKEIFKIFKEVFYQPYIVDKEGFVQMEDIERRESEVAKRICEIADISPGELISAIKQKSFGDKRGEHELYEVRKILLQSLEILDEDGEYLAELALNDELEWYSRFHAIIALTERKSKTHIEKLKVLLERDDLEAEIRERALHALSTNGFAEILPVIYKLYADPKLEKNWWDGREKLLLARGHLGDQTALRDIIAMKYSAWDHQQAEGSEALDNLVNSMGGIAPVLKYLTGTENDYGLNEALTYVAQNDRQDSVKRWANDVLSKEDPNEAFSPFIDSLGDKDWLVAQGASDILRNLEVSEPLLLAVVNDVEVDRSKKLWAIRTLLSRGIGVSKDALDSIEELFVPWEFSAPESVRNAIVCSYALYSEPETDVRYFIEAYLGNADPEYDHGDDDDEIVKCLQNLLRNENIDIKKIVHCGEFHGSGGGTYWILDLGFVQIIVSTIGRFISLIEFRDEWNFEFKDPPRTRSQQLDSLLGLVAENGFLILGTELLDNRVPGLNVYFFGARESLELKDLVYYWQD